MVISWSTWKRIVMQVAHDLAGPPTYDPTLKMVMEERKNACIADAQSAEVFRHVHPAVL